MGKDSELVGKLTIEFFDAYDEYVEPDDVSTETVRGAEMWVGFGLRPDLIGHGLGTGFVSACVEFAQRRHDYRGDYVRLAVAAFNGRDHGLQESGVPASREYLS